MSRKLFSSFSLLIVVAILVGSVAAPQGSAAAKQPGTPSDPAFVADELLVRFKPQTNPKRADQIVRSHGMRQVRSVKALDVKVLRLPPGLTVERAVEIFQRQPEVDLAEPNYILNALQTTPTEIDDQWGLTQIHTVEAWEQITTQNPVVIAIVDTGIDSSHPDLTPNIWENPGEISGDGIDNDANGYVDDTWGYDFYNNDGDPTGDNFHGTAVASVAAGVKDDYGVAGICPWCKLMAVKVLGAEGSGTLDVVANGITYAADNGANVINLSLGAAAGAQTLASAVTYAWAQGAVVAAAAGNDGNETVFYPAGYEEAIAVASTGPGDVRSCFSNYGTFVDVSAPGESIYTAVLDGGYGRYSGTSLSTPHVSGLAALLFSQVPSRSNAEVRTLIEGTAIDLGPTGRDNFFGTGRVDALRAVTGNDSPTTPPSGMFSDDDEVTGFPHQRKLARDASGNLHTVWHTLDNGEYKVLYASSIDSGATWSAPEVVFSSTAETYHPGLAVDAANVYIVFPTMDGGGSYYRTFFTKQPLGVENSWSPPISLFGAGYHAIRPDIFADPSNGRLHVVASSFDNQPYVYYTASTEQGDSWTAVQEIPIEAVRNTQYADVHAFGEHIYIATRSVELWFGLLPYFYLETVRSLDGGSTWTDLTTLESYMGFLSGAYGLSLAGVGDRLYLTYEHAGGIYFRQSEAGLGWSASVNLGSGVWPTISQESDGRAWVLWENNKEIFQRAYINSAWQPAVSLKTGTSYPNAKLDASAGLVEWIGTACNGAPFNVAYGSFLAEGGSPPGTHLKLVKVVNNNNGGTAVATDWTLSASGPTPISSPGGAESDVDPGTYTLSESGGPAGYTASEWVCTGTGTQTGNQIALDLGETATCTITNDDNAPTLRLRKTVTNDNGGTAPATAWTLSAAGPTPLSGTSPVDSGAGFKQGTYTLSESGGTAGYTASAWDCVGGTQNGNEITLSLGGSATCTITNNDNPAHLKLVKAVVGGTALATDWTLYASGPITISGPGGVESDVNAGTYTLTESAGPGDYTASAWVCVGGSQSSNKITLGLGQTATCTITNTYTPTQLKLFKVVDSNDGGTLLADDWTLYATALAPDDGLNFNDQGGSGSFHNVYAGVAYDLSESDLPGYTAGSWSCDGGSLDGSTVTLALGNKVTCTIHNTDDTPQLKLIKSVVNNDGGTKVANDWTLSAATTAVGYTSRNFNDLGGSGSFHNVYAGVAYDLSESVVTGYSSTGEWSCIGGVLDLDKNTVTLALGEQVTCTITNNDVSAHLKLVKVVVGGTASATDWTLYASDSTTTISGSGGVESDVKPGTYTLDESVGPAGYTASTWVCTGTGTQTGNQIALDLGESATCTITNTFGSYSTGFRSPTANRAVATGDRNGYEDNPTYAYADDGLYAVDNNSGTGTSTSYSNTKKDKHDFFVYNFPIPINATILGIEVRINAKVDATAGSPMIYVQLSWNGGKTWSVAQATPVLSTSEGTYTLGSASYTWGRTWLASNLNNTNFRVRVIDVSSSTLRDFSLDQIAVNVTYQP